jgi:uncharacterized protein (DUF1684 family)
MKKIFVFVLMFYAVVITAQNWSPDDAKAFQLNLNAEFADAKQSPLEASDLKKFKGLDFYPISAKYAVKARFVRTENQKPFGMKTSTSRLPIYVKYGELHFELDGKKCKLNLYQNQDLVKKPGYEDHLFLPFSDATSGKQTYIGGRYIDMKKPKSNEVLIDFNTAYNPYCAYNHKYSCPVVPLENDLPVAIEAGVQKFHD